MIVAIIDDFFEKIGEESQILITALFSSARVG
jgi:hypothetical protein